MEDKEKEYHYSYTHDTIEDKVELRGGIGNKVLYSYRVDNHELKDNVGTPALKIDFEYPSIHFNSGTMSGNNKKEDNSFIPIKNDKDYTMSINHNRDDSINKYYKTKLKHHIIIFTMRFIYNEKLCDWLTDIIYQDRLKELEN